MTTTDTAPQLQWHTRKDAKGNVAHLVFEDDIPVISIVGDYRNGHIFWDVAGRFEHYNFASADDAKKWCQGQAYAAWDLAHPPRPLTADEVLAAIKKYDIEYSGCDDGDDGDPRRWNAWGYGDDERMIDVYAATPALAIAKLVREAECSEGIESAAQSDDEDDAS
jgi:hypothetical protein